MQVCKVIAKIVICLVALTLLTACDKTYTIDKEKIDWSFKICKNNGGLKAIGKRYSFMDTYLVTTCSNGAVFTLRFYKFDEYKNDEK